MPYALPTVLTVLAFSRPYHDGTPARTLCVRVAVYALHTLSPAHFCFVAADSRPTRALRRNGARGFDYLQAREEARLLDHRSGRRRRQTGFEMPPVQGRAGQTLASVPAPAGRRRWYLLDTHTSTALRT